MMTSPLLRGLAVAALALAIHACGTTTGPYRDADDAATVDGSDDVDDDRGEDSPAPDADAAEDTDALTRDADDTPVACGDSLTCGSGEVCVIECLCCGIDTGSPDDARSEYRCVSPPVDCTDTPMACVERAEGCYAWGDRTCQIPCA